MIYNTFIVLFCIYVYTHYIFRKTYINKYNYFNYLNYLLPMHVFNKEVNRFNDLRI